MTDYGMTPQGFLRKRLDTIKTDLEEAIKSQFGAGANVAADGVFGKLVGVVAKPLADLWELAEAVYNALYPATAEGVNLENDCDLVGVHKQPAAKSTSNQFMLGTPLTTIPAGKLVAQITTGDLFALKAATQLDPDAARYAKAQVGTPGAAPEPFSLRINAETLSFTTSGGETTADIAEELADQVNWRRFPITAVNIGADKFTIADEHAAEFPANSWMRVLGSSGNDGAYYIVSATNVAGDTEIVVAQDVTDATIDGDILLSRFVNQSAAKIYPITAVDQLNQRFEVTGNATADINEGVIFRVHWSTGNDQAFTAVLSVYDGVSTTTITVEEAIPDPTVDGLATVDWRDIISQYTATQDYFYVQLSEDLYDDLTQFPEDPSDTPSFEIEPLTVNLTLTEVGVFGLFEATEDGALLAPPETLTRIETPVLGWTLTKNFAEAVPGRLVETDSELRIRRATSLHIPGASTVDAIRARILAVDGVTRCTVVENHLDEISGGRPPHSFEAIVTGGKAQDIGDTIWLAKPAGIRAFGDIDVDVLDSEGYGQTVAFSRPTPIPIWVHIAVVLNDEEAFADNARDQIKALFYLAGQALHPGNDAITQRLISGLFAEVTGIRELTVKYNLSAPANPYNPALYTVTGYVPIAKDEYAYFQLDRIVVV